MNKLLPYLFFAALLSACTNQEPPAQTTEEIPLTIESVTKEMKEGQCDSGGYDSKCANISLKYPVLTGGNDTLPKVVARWADNFMVSLLDPGMESGNTISVDSAMMGFIAMHREMTAEMPDMPAYYTVEVTDSVLFQDEKNLTLRLDAYSYTGGAHPNAVSTVTTFDIATGRSLTAVDFVNDLEALKQIAEQKFRDVQAEFFADGFEFDSGWPFKLADNIGLTEEGLLFCYIPYEVGPYALGFTEFVIPFNEIEHIRK